MLEVNMEEAELGLDLRKVWLLTRAAFSVPTVLVGSALCAVLAGVTASVWEAETGTWDPEPRLLENFQFVFGCAIRNPKRVYAIHLTRPILEKMTTEYLAPWGTGRRGLP